MISKNEKDTIKIAEQFAKTLHGGEVILLYGDLGVGKSIFVRAMAKTFGVKENVKSPTFNIMKCYNIINKEKNIKQLCHVDAYRLNSLDDLLDIGLEEYIGLDSVVVIEWAERVKGIERFAKKIIKIKINYKDKNNERIIKIK